MFEKYKVFHYIKYESERFRVKLKGQYNINQNIYIESHDLLHCVDKGD